MTKHLFHGVTAQRKAALKRLRDAEALLAEERSSSWMNQRGPHARGAMYLAGYAIECKLKAIAMETYRCFTLEALAAKWDVDERVVYQHGLEALARHLPLYNNFRQSGRCWRLFASQVNRWRPAWRYDPNDVGNQTAKEFLDAIRVVYNWLDANR